MYMNYDMVGSPNYIQMVYDADESSFDVPVGFVPDGSIAIEDLYESYYTLIGEPYDDAEFSGRSDYEAFILEGIPSGGLFTGAEEPKTALQQSIWGGTAGEQLDPCYHEACDTFANNDASCARGEQRPDRVCAADVRVLDAVGQRRGRVAPCQARRRCHFRHRQEPRGRGSSPELSDRRSGRASAARPLFSCEWSGIPVCSAIIDRSPDYELDDVLVVEDPKQLRALGDFTRGRIIGLLGQRAASTTELAAALDMPKGTVGHHLKVLEKAGLVRVVRTRQVRALTEKFYGRVARLFELKGVDSEADLRAGAISAMMLPRSRGGSCLGHRREGQNRVGRARLTRRTRPASSVGLHVSRTTFGMPRTRTESCTSSRSHSSAPRSRCRLAMPMRSLWPTGGLWRYSDFLKLWSAETISQFGSQVGGLAFRRRDPRPRRERVRGRGPHDRRVPAVHLLHAARRRLGRPPAPAPDPDRRGLRARCALRAIPSPTSRTS